MVQSGNKRLRSLQPQGGIKFQDGSPVTFEGLIKFAWVERLRVDVLNGGPTYFKTFLADTKNPYKGTPLQEDTDRTPVSRIFDRTA